MRILVCPTRVLLRRAENGELPPHSAAIVSHSAPIAEKDGAVLARLSRVISLEYDDVTDPRAPRPFTRDHAEKIVEFYRSLPADTPLYVTCDYGESRSAAIAAALRRAERNDEMRVWKDPRYHPNRLVYAHLCRALGLPAGAFLLSRRERANRRAFRRAKKNCGF